jgi:hypothetical protein
MGNPDKEGEQATPYTKFVDQAKRAIPEIWNPTGKAITAEYWTSKTQKKSNGKPRDGFSPMCGIKFDREAGCKLGKGVRCGDCDLHEYVPLTPDVVGPHLWGRKANHRRGIYPMLDGNLTAWIAGDLDNHDGKKDPEADIRRLIDVCSALEVPIVVFNSNSGAGYHVYIFFQQPILAAKARALLLTLFERAGVDISHTKDKEGSFDAVFPKQDRLKPGDVGNLIALPYSGSAIRARKATVMLDPVTLKPAGNGLLENLELFLECHNAITEEDVDGLLKEMGVNVQATSTKGGLDFSDAGNLVSLPQIVEQCAFLKHCRDDAANLLEPEWYLMVCTLAREFGGPKLVHELSRPYPGYSLDECREKINHALNDQPGPITCAKIKEAWDCGKDCGVKCPIHLKNPQMFKGSTIPDVPIEDIEQKLSELLKRDETEGAEAVYGAADLLASLPKKDDVTWRKRFKDAFGRSLNLNYLGEAINEIRKQRKQGAKRQTVENPDGLPVINVDSAQLPQITNQALEALEYANQPAPKLFVRSGSLVRIKVDEKERAAIELLSESALRGALARAALWLEDTRDGSTDTAPPMETVRDILSLTAWRFPALEAIIQTPTIRTDGSYLTTPGYDPSTGLYFIQDSTFSFPDLPEHPSQQDAARAAEFIFNEALHDFPFADQASKANALGLLLTCMIRQSMDLRAPVAVISASMAGTGKSLMAEVVNEISVGQPAFMTTAPNSSRQHTDDDEWRKRITSMLRTGAPNIVIDNVEGRIDSPSLASVTTVNIWSDRLLGRNEQIHLPQKSVWMVTGNNIKVAGDLPRRCFWIKLDAGMAKPFLRSGFKHSDIIAWIRENRGTIVAALLCIIRAWFVAGKPAGSAQDRGSFEGWTRVVSGILDHAGVEGFLGNAEELYEADDEVREWEVFLESWFSLYGESHVSTSKVTTDILSVYPNSVLESETGRCELRSALPEDLAVVLAKSVESFKKALGKQLAKREGFHFSSGYKIKKIVPNTKRISTLWRVERFQVGGFAQESETQNPPCQVIDFPTSGGFGGFQPLSRSYTENLTPLKDEKGHRYAIREVARKTSPKAPKPPNSTFGKEQSLVKCQNCTAFDGRWCIAERSWDGRRGQEPDVEHPCHAFQARMELGK